MNNDLCGERVNMNRFHAIACAVIVSLAFALRASAAIQDASPTSVLQGVYTAAQAEEGAKQFQLACGSCHTVGEHTHNSFVTKWTTLGEAFDVISNTMPQTDPGGLKADDYANIIAFFLKTTGYPEGSRPLPASTDVLKQIRVERPAAK
jgi:S-disulfanyl-L-cysteine oxidoreductase SoxD